MKPEGLVGHHRLFCVERVPFGRNWANAMLHIAPPTSVAFPALTSNVEALGWWLAPLIVSCCRFDVRKALDQEIPLLY